MGIGASAGGLAAFEEFFAGMPADAELGMAFVFVQHLAPDHKSILSELVRRYTSLNVFEVEDGMRVQANCVYIIPPNRDMAVLNGALHLLQPAAPRGLRLPIDFFFRSLAQDRHDPAICIVLSGTGSDGTLGARAIKGEGGMVMAQTPASTEYDGMPRSVIGTGLVDYVLPPVEMPDRLIAFAARLLVKTNGSFSRVNLTVRPAEAGPNAVAEPGLFVVILEDAAAPDQTSAPTAAAPLPGEAAEAGSAETTDADARIAGLTRELRAKDEYLQTTHEELATSNEELKSSNEEMQSVNEELQSANEELETSKEELQSINEELTTVNAELQTKLGDVSRANNDMNNLLAGTAWARSSSIIRYAFNDSLPRSPRSST